MCRVNMLRRSRYTSEPCTSENKSWVRTIPSHKKSYGTMQGCCARWGEKLKRASWKGGFLLLPERYTAISASTPPVILTCANHTPTLPQDYSRMQTSAQ